MPQMTPTPDTALAARLARLCGGEHEAEADGDYDTADLDQACGNAYRSGQLITLADHTAAVQAAVAKAVDDTLDAAHEYTDKTYSMQFLSHPVDRERIAAILARAHKGDAL
jgi:Zn-dependent protease with chaperone function